MMTFRSRHSVRLRRDFLGFEAGSEQQNFWGRQQAAHARESGALGRILARQLAGNATAEPVQAPLAAAEAGGCSRGPYRDRSRTGPDVSGGCARPGDRGLCQRESIEGSEASGWSRTILVIALVGGLALFALWRFNSSRSGHIPGAPYRSGMRGPTSRLRCSAICPGGRPWSSAAVPVKRATDTQAQAHGSRGCHCHRRAGSPVLSELKAAQASFSTRQARHLWT